MKFDLFGSCGGDYAVVAASSTRIEPKYLIAMIDSGTICRCIDEELGSVQVRDSLIVCNYDGSTFIVSIFVSNTAPQSFFLAK